MAFLAPALSFVASTLVPIASTGLSIASAAGAFDKKSKSAGDSTAALMAANQRKEAEAAEAEEQKRKAWLARMAGGKTGSILTGGRGVTGNQTILKQQLGA